MQDKKYTLLGILQSYAPSVTEQQQCTTLYNKAIHDGATDFDMEIMLASAIADGLKYGNWPWTKSPKE